MLRRPSTTSSNVAAEPVSEVMERSWRGGERPGRAHLSGSARQVQGAATEP
jgi:hypothetical protein